MIAVRVSEGSRNRLFLELQHKIEGIKEANSALTKKEIADAVFSMSALDFVKSTNMKAKSMRKSLHHVYDWNQVGKESGRLFKIIKANQMPGSMSIYYKFNNSKKVVPIPKELRSPGKNGKSVKKSTIFKKKAEVMESGKPVSFITSKTIVFLSGKSIKFVPRGKLIRINSPGGEATSGGFFKYFMAWWSVKPEQVLEKSGMIFKIEKNLARALTVKSAGKTAARNSINKTTSAYTTIGSIL